MFIDGLRKEMEEQEEQWTQEMGEYVPIVYSVKVKVLGCWDTAVSLGFPWRPIKNAGGVSGQCRHFDGSLVKGQFFILISPSEP